MVVVVHMAFLGMVAHPGVHQYREVVEGILDWQLVPVASLIVVLGMFQPARMVALLVQMWRMLRRTLVLVPLQAPVVVLKLLALPPDYACPSLVVQPPNLAPIQSLGGGGPHCGSDTSLTHDNHGSQWVRRLEVEAALPQWD